MSDPMTEQPTDVRDRLERALPDAFITRSFPALPPIRVNSKVFPPQSIKIHLDEATAAKLADRLEQTDRLVAEMQRAIDLLREGMTALGVPS